jgi:hypothetical protein
MAINSGLIGIWGARARVAHATTAARDMTLSRMVGR